MSVCEWGIKLLVEHFVNGRVTNEVLERVEGLRDLFNFEKNSRSDRDGNIKRKLEVEVERLTENLIKEKAAREELTRYVKEELSNKERILNLNYNQFTRNIIEDINALRESLQRECETREQVDEHMVTTIDQIVKQLHESLRIVTKSDTDM